MVEPSSLPFYDIIYVISLWVKADNGEAAVVTRSLERTISNEKAASSSLALVAVLR